MEKTSLYPVLRLSKVPIFDFKHKYLLCEEDASDKFKNKKL